ncbi:MAG TPA: ABC transporter permease [Actinomycetota bacterium]|nr:ABC transporter permease [Actinomycetota bacterium]
MSGFLEGLQWLVANEHWSGSDGIPHRVWEHVQVSLIALVIAAAVAVPVGLWVGHTRRGQFITVQLSNIGRAIPSLAVLSIAFLLAVKLSPTLAFGFPPVVVALIILAIPVILINTYVGIQQVDADTVEAARGMGMSGWQILFDIELPLAAPLILTGLRLSAVLIVATAGLWALTAGGALGRYIVDGFALQETDRVVAGAILIALLAICVDALFTVLTRILTPRQRSRSAAEPGRLERPPA